MLGARTSSPWARQSGAHSYILGLAYPAVVSIQAIESRTTVDDTQVRRVGSWRPAACIRSIGSGVLTLPTQWLTYWLVYAVMTLVEAVIYPYFKWCATGGVHNDCSTTVPLLCCTGCPCTMCSRLWALHGSCTQRPR